MFTCLDAEAEDGNGLFLAGLIRAPTVSGPLPPSLESKLLKTNYRGMKVEFLAYPLNLYLIYPQSSCPCSRWTLATSTRRWTRSLGRIV